MDGSDAPAPRVAVVIPVGALDDHLGVQLDALGAQHLDEPWELVLALNDPAAVGDPRLEELLDRVPAGRAVDASDVRSASHARNRGAAATTAELLVFCDGDDVVAPGWLAEMVTALATEPFVGGHLDEESLGIRGQEDWRPPATPGALPTFLGHPYVVSANLGVRRELFERIGGFDEDLVRGEDMAFSFAAVDLGVSPRYVPGAVVAYRHRAGLRPLLRQHYLYGQGMSQIIARGGLPAGARGGAFRANGQPVPRRSVVHVARRAAIAAGRLRGLVAERARGRARSRVGR